jgi:hypothetical protein
MKDKRNIKEGNFLNRETIYLRSLYINISKEGKESKS